MVEQEAVNFEVVSSSLTGGAIFLCYYFYMKSLESRHRSADLDQRDPEHISKISEEDPWGSLGNVPFAGDRKPKPVSSVEEMRRLLDSLPNDVDDEIKQAAEAVEAQQQSREDATLKKREEVLKTFQTMDAVGSFGRSARERREKAKEMTEEEKNELFFGNS